MIIQNKYFRGLVIYAAVTLLSMPLHAQSENPEWIGDLETQLLLDEDCRVIEYEAMHEGKLGGRAIYNARIVCEDGRKLDAHRIGQVDDFTIRACEIVRC